MFKILFRTKFNIGFSSPASDSCALCNRLKYKLRIEKDVRKKVDFITKIRVHKKRANAFYELMRQVVPDSYSFCFDMQQVQPLPRTPINDAFYAQQISFYVLSCVDVQSRYPTFYTWTEDLAGRRAIEVSSALLAHLNSLNLNGIKTLRLFCDGCGGQNKNSHVVHTLYFWLKRQSPKDLLEIRLNFPVRGHSFLPADRVLEGLKRNSRSRTHPSIKKKEGYEQMYSRFGEGKSLGTAWLLYDVKTLGNVLKKVEGIADMKRIVLRKGQSSKTTISVTCFQNFRYESGLELPKTLLKKGKKESELKLDLMELDHVIKDKKKKSLKHLLQQEFGEGWEEDQDLIWYKNILLRDEEPQEEEEEEEERCDCLEDDAGIHI